VWDGEVYVSAERALGSSWTASVAGNARPQCSSSDRKYFYFHHQRGSSLNLVDSAADFVLTSDTPIAVGFKVCSLSDCEWAGTPQPLSNFYLHHGKAKDGYRPECKKCTNRLRAAWARERYVPKTGRRWDVSQEGKARRKALRDARDARRAQRERQKADTPQS
jgi:hypothetical protein